MGARARWTLLGMGLALAALAAGLWVWFPREGPAPRSLEAPAPAELGHAKAEEEERPLHAWENQEDALSADDPVLEFLSPPAGASEAPPPRPRALPPPGHVQGGRLAYEQAGRRLAEETYRLERGATGEVCLTSEGSFGVRLGPFPVSVAFRQEVLLGGASGRKAIGWRPAGRWAWGAGGSR